MVRSWCSLAAVALIAGCGSKPSEKEAPLTFHQLDGADTAGLSRGAPLLRTVEIQRDPAGAITARGRLDLPEGTRLELIVYAPGGSEVLGRTQFALRDGRFESPPVFGAGGPLPEGRYRFQLRGRFDPSLQPPEVMAAAGRGRGLHGPGVIRTADGLFAFVHDEELRR
jgi:hypothetical protein